MEGKINIAAILESKPQGTKLYSLTYGDCSYQGYTGDFGIECQSQNGVQFNLDEYGKYCIEGECILFPSKEMRDWNKFAWKKGDVLVNSRGLKILFDRWANDKYTSFYAKTINLVEDAFLDTNLHTLASEKEAKSFVKCIEEKLGGKLNLETLEIEKAQHEFKDGDIVCISGMGYLAYGIVKSIDNSSKKLEYYVLNDMSTLKFEDWLSFEDKQIQPITETQQIILFEALAKEGKAWDAEHKMIVDLKPKWTPKPFDRVITRTPETPWTANFFSHIDSDGIKNCIDDRYIMCLPYNDETAKLIGTTNNWRG